MAEELDRLQGDIVQALVEGAGWPLILARQVLREYRAEVLASQPRRRWWRRG